ncbi:MAG: GNAT family N-acetyltransferase [Sulfolobales archaeon]
MTLEVKYTSQVFYVKFDDGSKAFLGYKVEDNKMFILETYTPPQHRGQGVAKLLVEKALEMARERGLKVVPICSYSIHYFIKNPNMRDLLAEPYASMSEYELSKYYEESLKRETSKKRA